MQIIEKPVKSILFIAVAGDTESITEHDIIVSNLTCDKKVLKVIDFMMVWEYIDSIKTNER